MAEFPVRYGRIREEPRISPQGLEVVSIVVPIWLGDHGPFTERLSKEEYADGTTLRARVEALKTTLRGLPE